jgi:hypothetical protein
MVSAGGGGALAEGAGGAVFAGLVRKGSARPSPHKGPW